MLACQVTSVMSDFLVTSLAVAPLSMGFSRKEYWSGLPFPSPDDLPNPGVKPGSSALQAESLPTEREESPVLLLAEGNGRRWRLKPSKTCRIPGHGNLFVFLISSLQMTPPLWQKVKRN